MARSISNIIQNNILQQKEEEEFEDSNRLVRSGVAGYEGLKGSFNNAAAAASRVVGADDTAQSFEIDADRNAARAAGIRGAVPTYGEAEGVGDYAETTADLLASNGALLGTNLGGAAIGGLIGSAFGGVGAPIGAAIGGYLPYAATSSGENYGRIRNDPEAEGTPSEQGGAALTAGAAQGALGALPLASGLKLLSGAAKTGVARGVAQTAAAEGVTEAAESGISRYTHSQFNPEVNMFDADARREYIESAIGGAVVGGGYGAIGAGVGKLLNIRKGRQTEQADQIDSSIDFDEGAKGDNDRVAHMINVAQVMRENPYDETLQESGWEELSRQRGRMNNEERQFEAEEVMADLGREQGLATPSDEQGPSRVRLDPKEEVEALLAQGALSPGEATSVSYLDSPNTHQPYGYKGPGTKILDNLNAFDPDNSYGPISVRDQLREQYDNTPIEGEARRVPFGTLANQEAQKLFDTGYREDGTNRFSEWMAADNAAAQKEGAGSASPGERFLSRFQRIKKTPLNLDAAAGGDPLSLSFSELRAGGNKTILSIREKPKHTGAAKYGQREQNRELAVSTSNGSGFLDIPNLTNQMMGKLASSGLMPEGVSKAVSAMVSFASGMTSIINNPAVDNVVDPAPGLIIWRSADENTAPILYEDLTSLRSRYATNFRNIDRMLVLQSQDQEAASRAAYPEDLNPILDRMNDREDSLRTALSELDTALAERAAQKKEPKRGADRVADTEEIAGENPADTGLIEPQPMQPRRARSDRAPLGEKEERIEQIEDRTKGADYKPDIALQQAKEAREGEQTAKQKTIAAEKPPLDNTRTARKRFVDRREIVRLQKERKAVGSAGMTKKERKVEIIRETPKADARKMEEQRAELDQKRIAKLKAQRPKKTAPKKTAPKKTAPKKTAPKKTAPKKAATTPNEVLRTEKLRALQAKQTKSRTFKQLQKLADAVSKAFKLKGLPLMTVEEAVELRLKQAGVEGIMPIESGEQHGFRDVTTGKIFIHPNLEGKQAVAVLMHELGHAVQRAHFDALPANSPVRRDIDAEWKKWRSEMIALGTTGDVKGTTQPAGSLAADKKASVPLEGHKRRTYILSFEEWFANNVARWADTAAVPQTAVEKFFKRVADSMGRLLETVNKKLSALGLPQYKAAKTVSEFMDQLMQDTRTPPKQEVTTATSGSTAGAQKVTETATKRQPKVVASGGSGGGKPPRKPATAAAPGSENGGGLLGALHSWHSAFKAGQTTVLSKRMVRAVQMHMKSGLSTSNYRVLLRAAEGTAMQTAMRKVLGGNPEVTDAIAKDPELAAAYLYALTRLGAVKAGPQAQTAVDNFTAGMEKLYETTFGDMSAEAQETAVLKAIEKGQVDAGSALDFIELPVELRENKRRATLRTYRDKWRKFYDKTYGRAMTTPFERLQRSENPFLKQVARSISSPPWDSRGREPGFLETKGRRNAEFMHSYAAALGDKLNDTEYKRAVLAAFLNPDKLKTATPEVQSSVRKIRKIFDRFYKYTNESGLEFTKRGDYFPWIFNKQYLEANFDALHTMALQPHYRQKWAEMYSEWLAKKRVKAKDVKTVEAFIEQRLRDLMKADGVGSGETEDGSHNPGFRFMNPRDLNFLQHSGTAADKKLLASYFEQGLDNTMTQYINSGVKRAEYARQFGTKGEKLVELLKKAGEHGASAEELALARGYVLAATGMYGYETRQFIERVLKDTPLPAAVKKLLTPEDAGSGVINENLANLYGWAITYQNYRLLILSAFSSFIDPLGVGVRSADVGIMGASLSEAMKAVYAAAKGDKSQLLEMAHMVGTLERAMVAEDIAADYTGHQFTGLARKLNDTLFKYNQVENLTKFSRLVSTHGAGLFIIKHDKARESNETSLRYLEELALRKGDVKSKNGHLVFLTEEQRGAVSKAERARDDRLRGAVHRFVDSSTIRPDASKRPLWGSDQHYALVMHLKQFFFAFHDTIYKRVGSEAMQGEYMPALLMAATFVPMMLFADWLRDMIKYGEEGASWKRHWTLEDHIAYAVKRAGLYGRDELLADIADPLFKGDVVRATTEALGPSASQLRQISQYGLSERDLPGQVLYRNWD